MKEGCPIFFSRSEFMRNYNLVQTSVPIGGDMRGDHREVTLPIISMSAQWETRIYINITVSSSKIVHWVYLDKDVEYPVEVVPEGCPGPQGPGLAGRAVENVTCLNVANIIQPAPYFLALNIVHKV